MPLNSFPISRPATLRLAVRSDLGEVRPVASIVRNFMKDQGFDDAEVQAAELAFVEACNNAIKYAGPRGAGECVMVDVLCTEENIELRITDNTDGFDWPETVELPDFEKETGRGIFLINTLMDRVSYLRGRGQNCLVMRKKRRLRSEARHIEFSSLEEASLRLTESEQVIRDMAEELSFCYESLSAIFRCSSELGKSNNLEEFARRLLTDLAQITSADWFLFRLINRDGTALEPFSWSDPMVQPQALSLTGESFTGSVEVEAACTREDVWFDHLNPLPSQDFLRTIDVNSIGLVHPIFLGERLIGTLTVAKSAPGTLFTAVQANVVHTFADFLAIQIVNARFNEEQLRGSLVNRELEIAKAIQRSLLPKSLPPLPGYDLAGFCESARQVGGDFYDVLKIGDDSALLIIADVMGKGVPAAMFAAILRSLLRAVPEWTNQPAALLARVNRLLFEELSGVDMFITAQLVFIDGKERKLTAASAGHCPVLLWNSTEPEVKLISPEGMPLGILPDTTFTNQTETLFADSRLLLYTDGLTEARNQKGEFYGQERLVAWLKNQSNNGQSAEALKEKLAGELRSFQANMSLNDDQTFLIMTE
ncbi:MAG: SpoIIE family protein phosphatase [Verrucomicrobiota bacterium]|nr:SpoIIE family protein phosphatase [Verrucomicrobiota bacterium]